MQQRQRQRQSLRQCMQLTATCQQTQARQCQLSRKLTTVQHLHCNVVRPLLPLPQCRLRPQRRQPHPAQQQHIVGQL